MAPKDLWWLLGILLGLWLIWVWAGGPAKSREVSGGPFLHFDETPAPAPVVVPRSVPPRRDVVGYGEAELPAELISPWQGQVTVSTGNASSEYQANQEYIELSASGSNQAPINISGWQLANRPNWRRFYPSIVPIPFATQLYITPDLPVRDPIVLAPGGRAVVVTGRPPLVGLYRVAHSFRVNQCSGYLNERDYGFVPSLSSICPRVGTAAELNLLDEDCYDFVRSAPSCRVPEFERRGDIDYVDNYASPSPNCRQFIQARFNYPDCLARHSGDPDFWTDDWRIFLGQPGEMWGKSRETIALYDRDGKLVDQLNY
ncbi:MAG: hypothetical protein AAB468_01915 [Patescibacteria group bacterium]